VAPLLSEGASESPTVVQQAEGSVPSEAEGTAEGSGAVSAEGESDSVSVSAGGAGKEEEGGLQAVQSEAQQQQCGQCGC